MLHIERESAYADKIRAYILELDGELIGQIDDGESKDCEITPGAHTLQLKLSWTSSNIVQFEASKDGIVHFRCASSLKGTKVLMASIYALLLPHRYIKLEQL